MYEIVNILHDRIFIVMLEEDCSLYDFVPEWNEEFGDCRFILTDLNTNRSQVWYEVVEWGEEVVLKPYQESIPDIKPWEKILNRSRKAYQS
jgi:hypothetical protein